MKKHFSILLMLTEKCNCNCYFCSRNNLSYNGNEIVSLDSIKEALSILSKEYSDAKLILTGGEPTLYPWIKEVIIFAKEKFRKIEIQTNGWFPIMISEQLKPFLKSNVYIQFSLDGTQNSHNNIRGKYFYERVISNILFFNQESNHISISSTITKSNIKTYYQLVDKLNSLKFKRLTVSMVQYNNPKEDDIIDKEEWNRFVDKLITLCRFRVDIAKIYDFDLMDKYLDKQLYSGRITNCGLGKTHFYIKPNLDVLPCTCIDNVVGNLLKDSIDTIKKNLAKYEFIEINKDSVCNECNYRIMCNGGCPGYSIKIFGKPGMGDFRCPKVLEYAKSQVYL